MSRLGKLPIELPQGTKAALENGMIVVRGPKGELSERTHETVKVDISDSDVRVSVPDPENKRERALWGLYWSLIRNMVKGVNEGYEKKLEINGVGFRAAMSGQALNLNVGFSHPVVFDIPKGISANVAGNVITVQGISKQLVGETAARIRKIKKPEPYKGKGIKYADEVIKRKQGKSAGKGKK
jgi:large subunit ribosomal protein L6